MLALAALKPIGICVWGILAIKEVLKLMRDQNYNFPATVEYEYRTPKGSSVIEEVKKSIEYCKNALES